MFDLFDPRPEPLPVPHLSSFESCCLLRFHGRDLRSINSGVMMSGDGITGKVFLLFYRDRLIMGEHSQHISPRLRAIWRTTVQRSPGLDVIREIVEPDELRISKSARRNT